MGKPRILTPHEVQGLKRNGIKTLAELWERISADYDHQVRVVSWLTGVSREKLEALLVAEEGRETEFTNGWWWHACWLWLKRQSRLPLWIEGGLFILVLLLSLFLLRALWVRERLLSPIGLEGRVLVAKRDLKAGSALKPDDFDSAQLVSGGDYVPGDENLTGCFLTRDIGWGKALGFAQVRRQQLVATKDIPAEAGFGAGAVTLTWTTFQPHALTDPKQVEGRMARHPIPSGSVVLSDYLK